MAFRIGYSVVLMLLAVVGVTQAQTLTLAQYAFDGTVASLTSIVSPSNATVSTFGEGPNTQGAVFDFATRFGVNRAYSIPTPDGNYTSADNLADGEYMVFTVTGDSSYLLDLSNLTFRASRNGGGGTINQLDLYVSVDGGAFSKVGATVALNDSSNPGTTARDLSAPAFQGVRSATFAFVFFNGYLNRGYLDDIALTGSMRRPAGTLVFLR